MDGCEGTWIATRRESSIDETITNMSTIRGRGRGRGRVEGQGERKGGRRGRGRKAGQLFTYNLPPGLAY